MDNKKLSAEEEAALNKIKYIQSLIDIEKEAKNPFFKTINDGYHSFEDLYTHRRILTEALFYRIPFTWKSKHHFDEETDPMFDGDFNVGAVTPYGMISYHYKLDYWDEFKVPAIVRAPRYDGYTPDDVIDRIKKFYNRSITRINEEDMTALYTMVQQYMPECFDDPDEYTAWLQYFIKKDKH